MRDAGGATAREEGTGSPVIIATFASGDTEKAASLLAEGYIQHNLAYGTGRDASVGSIAYLDVSVRSAPAVSAGAVARRLSFLANRPHSRTREARFFIQCRSRRVPRLHLWGGVAK